MIALPASLTSIAVVAGALLFFRSISTDLWTILMLPAIGVRRRMTTTVVFVVLFLVIGIAASSTHLYIAAVPFIAITLVPPIAWQLIKWLAWCTDPRSVRDAAFAIAVERSARFGEVAPAMDQRTPWPEYVFDAEDARRQEAYEPPPI